MKPILLVISSIAAFSLAGCASSLSQFESGAASLGAHSPAGTDTSQVETLSAATPAPTGATTVPQTAGDVQQASDGAETDPDVQNADAGTLEKKTEESEEIDEQNLTDEERHRLELINRGDIEENQVQPQQ